MAGSTPNYSLRYPEDPDPVDIAVDIQNLATDVDTQLSLTHDYVDISIANLVDTSPSTLDTLNELAAALGNDPNFATTVTSSIAGKLSLTGGTLSGDLTISKTDARLILNSSTNAPVLSIRGPAATERTLTFSTGSSRRWQIMADSGAESGSNAGSDLYIQAFNDSAGFLSSPVAITRSTGAVALTGDLTVNKGDATFTLGSGSGAGVALIKGAAGNARNVRYATGSTLRWAHGANTTAESGSNAGSNFEIQAYSDAGALLSTPLTITRSTGKAVFSGILEAGTSIGITSGPTWVNDAGKWMTSSNVRIDGTIYAVGGTVLFGGTSDVSLSRNAATSLLSNSDLTISKANPVLKLSASSGSADLYLDTTAANAATIQLRTGTSTRWNVYKDSSAESSTATGSDFYLAGYNNSGSFIGNYLQVQRSTGRFTVYNTGAGAGIRMGAGGAEILSGTGSPEGVVTAPVGSIWFQTDSTVGVTHWRKASGTGNTGWVAMNGNTGLRDIRTLANSIPTLTLSVWTVYRVDNTVTMNLTIADTQTNPYRVALGQLPSGFRPTATSYVSAPYDSAVTSYYRNLYIGSDGSIQYGGPTYASGFPMSFTWMTSNPWPTSLPGSAA